MTVCERLWNGRQLHNKMLSEPALTTDEFTMFALDARRGSEMLRNAIFRAAGYSIPEPPKAPPPVFKPVKIKIVRPRGRVKKTRVPNPVVTRIIQLVAERYKLTPDDILGRDRTREIVIPRHVAMYLARKIEGVSYPDLGWQFGGRDHSTVVNGCNEIDRLIDANDTDTIRALRTVKDRLAA